MSLTAKATLPASAETRSAMRLASPVYLRVVQQVGEDRVQRVAIGGDARQRLGGVAGELAPRRIEPRAQRTEHLIHERPHFQRRDLQPLLPALQPRECEEILRQPAQTQVLLGDEVEIFAELLLAAVAALAQRIHEHPHRGERRAQLMRDGGHGGGFQLVDLELAAHREPRCTGDGEDGDDRRPRDPDVKPPLVAHTFVDGRIAQQMELHLPRQIALVQPCLRDGLSRRDRNARERPARAIHDPHRHRAVEQAAVEVVRLLRRQLRRTRRDVPGKGRARREQRLLVDGTQPLPRDEPLPCERVEHEPQHERRRDERHEHEQEKQRAKLLRADLVRGHRREGLVDSPHPIAEAFIRPAAHFAGSG